MKNTLIVIPTYNEADNIEAIICELLSINEDYHVLVVDDSSPDGTGTLVAKGLVCLLRSCNARYSQGYPQIRPHLQCQI